MTKPNSKLTRRSMMTGSAAAAGAALAAPHLGRSATAQDATPMAGGTLIFGGGAPSSLVVSPMYTSGFNQNQLIEASFLRLVYGQTWGDGINPDPSSSELELAVAESIEEIEPNRVWEFGIRDNVLWHDGEPVTVDDVIFGLWLSMNKNTLATNETPPVGLKGRERLMNEGAAVGDIEVEGLTKLGDRGLRVELVAPMPNYWVNWGIGYWPYPKHIYGETPFEDLWHNSPHALTPIGNGPFKLVNFVEGQYAEFEANDDFYLGRPLLDKFIVRFGDDDTLTAALESQEIHGAAVAAGAVLDRMSTLDHLVPNSIPSTHPIGFAINWERWPDHASALGRAIWRAIDINLLNEQLFSNTLQPSNNIFGHVFGLESLPEGFPEITYDPDAARAILSEVDWDPATELEWMMWSPPGAVQDAMQAMLAEVGINAKYKQIDLAAVVDELYVAGNFDLVHGNFGPQQSMLDNWKYIKCGWIYDEGGYNFSRYCNEEVDALWQSALDDPDFTAARPIWDQINLEFGQNPAQATQWRASRNYVWNSRVRGAYPFQNRLPVRPAFERVWLAEE